MASFPWEQVRTVHYFGSFWAPMVALSCRGPDGRARAISFVLDTGAVHSVMKFAVGQVLGIPFDKGTPFEIRGIGGAQTLARVHVIPVELDGRDLLIPFAIAEHNNVPNLLGRYGVIDRHHRKKTTTLARRL